MRLGPAKRRRPARLLALAPLLLAGAALAQGEAPAPAEGAAGEAPARAASGLAELESQIAALRTRADEWAARSAEYEETRQRAPRRLREIVAEIARLETRRDAPVEKGGTLSELENRLIEEERALAGVRQELAELQQEGARRSERRRQIPELLAAARERLGQPEPEPAPEEGVDARLREARRQLAGARRQAAESEIAAYQAELDSYEARGALLARRLDLASLRVSRLEPRVGALQEAVQDRRHLAAEQAATQARESLEEATSLAPELREVVTELAEQNSELALQRVGEEGLVGKIHEIGQKLARVQQQVAEVEADFADIARKVEAVGLIDSVGLALRRQRSKAPEIGKYRRFIRMRQELINSVQLRQIELREQRTELADVDTLVEQAVAGLDPSLAAGERERIATLMRDLLETRRRYLDALIEDYETYFQRLVDFDAAQQQLIERTERLIRYIDERILWVPSGRSVQAELLSDGLDAARWLFDPRNWGQLGRALAEVAVRRPLSSAVVAGLLLLALPLSRRLRARLDELGGQAQSPSCTRFGPTAEALGLSLLPALWIPGALAYLGWQLGDAQVATQFVRCIAHGLLAALLVWLTLAAPRQILRPGGLAEAHLAWPEGAVRDLRRHLGWLAAVAVPAVFLIFVFELRDEDAWRESVGRIVLLAALVAAAAFTHLAMRETGGSLPRILGSERIGRRWQWRLQHALALAVPLLLALAALRGYYWTSLRLASQYHLTVVFLFGLLVAFRLFRRWSLLAGRRAALDEARRRQQAEALRALEREAGEAPPAEPELDLAEVSAQTSQLLRAGTRVALVVGLWLIWAGVLPAVGILRQVELWDRVETVRVEAPAAADAPRGATEQRVVPVTLMDLLVAVGIAIVALVLVRNLPGFLELSLMRRLGIGAGERYAYATLSKYLIAAAGIALTLGAVGVGWSNIQWLVAAVGLGLGFGLQEIFANFVSGLIILFERPVRVGDTVTVGDVSGTVSKIRIRATWITSFDRKELVVPNKEFVTSRLVNWSLSDAVLREDIPVGIAYGSDTELAIRVLRQVAEANERVLADPPPQALFLGFGDSSLSFVLRVFSPDAANLLPIRHELHMAIDKAFREAGIEISFPQRDLHLRSVPRAWIRGESAEGGSDA